MQTQGLLSKEAKSVPSELAPSSDENTAQIGQSTQK